MMRESRDMSSGSFPLPLILDLGYLRKETKRERRLEFPIRILFPEGGMV